MTDAPATDAATASPATTASPAAPAPAGGLRAALAEAMKAAMRAGDRPRLSAVRLMQAAVKDRDIEARGAGRGSATEEELTALLRKMLKQRRESLAIFEGAGREDLAGTERAEAAVIEGFLPATMDEAGVDAAVAAAITATGAATMKDMGKVVAHLRGAHAGALDMALASARVKAALGGEG